MYQPGSAYMFSLAKLFDLKQRLFHCFRQLDIPSAASELASEKRFEIEAYSLSSLALPEQTRQPRIVRIGAIQNAIVLPTDKPVIEQVGHSQQHQVMLAS